MKRLYIYLLGALAVVSCAKVAPEVPDGEQNQSEQDELEVIAQGFRLTFQMDGISKLEIESVDGYPLGLDGNSIIEYKGEVVPGGEEVKRSRTCVVCGG